MYICKVVFVLKDIQGEASSSSVAAGIGFSSSHDPVIEWPVTAILTDVVYIRYLKFI